jgi:uncharacterized CHY-type Zn-finger protein
MGVTTWVCPYCGARFAFGFSSVHSVLCGVCRSALVLEDSVAYSCGDFTLRVVQEWP